MPDEKGRNAVEGSLRFSIDTTDLNKASGVLDELVTFAQSKGLTIEGYGLDRYPGVRSDEISHRRLPSQFRAGELEHMRLKP